MTNRRKKSDYLQTPVEPFRVDAGLGADEVLARMERISFQGRNLAAARRVWKKMLGDDVMIFLGMAGALSAAGMLCGADLARDVRFDGCEQLAQAAADGVGQRRSWPCARSRGAKRLGHELRVWCWR